MQVDSEAFPVSGGLTQTRMGLTYTATFQGNAPGVGKASCLHTKDIMIDVSYAVDVYISKEYKRGSCQYRVLKDRGMRHAAIAQSTLHDFQPEIEKMLTKRLQAIKPQNEWDAYAAKKVIQKNIEDILKMENKEFLTAHKARQKAMTTRSEYLRSLRICARD